MIPAIIAAGRPVEKILNSTRNSRFFCITNIAVFFFKLKPDSVYWNQASAFNFLQISNPLFLDKSISQV